MKRTILHSGKLLLAVFAILMLVVLAACAPASMPPKADGGELYTYITQQSNYKEWKMWPGRGELYPGTPPHGAFLTTYVTDKGFSAIQNKKGSIPVGSIIVKENYGPDRQLAAITVMYKIKGYDAANSDWFWAKYQTDGTIDAEGKVETCIACHGIKRQNDFIYTGDLKE